MGKTKTEEITNIEVFPLAGGQLDFFNKALLRISTKEDQRALEAIVKECLRLGVSDTTIREMLKLMAIDNPDIKDAAEKIDKL